jgi:trehalose 6-phosphate synthase
MLTIGRDSVGRSPNDLHYGGHKVIVHGFPIGIEPEEFKQKVETEEVQKEIAVLEDCFKEGKVIVGVDRLDYIKGIPQKLRAYDRFLTENPDWIGKVTLVQLAIPTRADVDTYKRLREEVERLVAHVNGKHSTVFLFFIYQHRC